MDLRLRTLDHLDDRAVPLPHGTEVVTRVDRIVGERRVPQGSVGRVTKVDGEELDVTIVGVGVVRYARGELSPRRVGQVLFAQRRADTWEALRPCVVLEATVGSHAWGLADEDSDVDHRGVFALPFPWTQGLVAPSEDLVSADGSETYWAAGKAVRQALCADPTPSRCSSCRAPDRSIPSASGSSGARSHLDPFAETLATKPFGAKLNPCGARAP